MQRVQIYVGVNAVPLSILNLEKCCSNLADLLVQQWVKTCCSSSAFLLKIRSVRILGTILWQHMFVEIVLAVLSCLGCSPTHPESWLHLSLRGIWPYWSRSSNSVVVPGLRLVFLQTIPYIEYLPFTVTTASWSLYTCRAPALRLELHCCCSLQQQQHKCNTWILWARGSVNDATEKCCSVQGAAYRGPRESSSTNAVAVTKLAGTPAERPHESQHEPRRAAA